MLLSNVVASTNYEGECAKTWQTQGDSDPNLLLFSKNKRTLLFTFCVYLSHCSKNVKLVLLNTTITNHINCLE